MPVRLVIIFVGTFVLLKVAFRNKPKNVLDFAGRSLYALSTVTEPSGETLTLRLLIKVTSVVLMI